MRPITEPALTIGYHCRVAKNAEENGDFCVASSYLLEQRRISRHVTLGLVADGIGGDARAEEASQLASQVVRRCFNESDSSDVLSLLYQAFNQANRILHERGLTYSEVGGRLGTTMAAAVVVDNRLYIANVGDSRIYLQQPGGKLVQVTRDHTRALVDDQPAESVHPAAPTLERFLGRSPEVTVDFCLRLKDGQTEQQMLANQGVVLRPGARVLLVTDGVTDEADNSKIKSIINEASPHQATERLTQAAHRSNRHENASALILQIPSDDALTASPPVRTLLHYGVTGVTSLLVLAALIFASLHFGVPLVEGMLEPGTSDEATVISPDLIKLETSPSTTATETSMPLLLPSHTPTVTSTPTATVTLTPTLTPTWTPTYTPTPTWTPRPYVPPPPPPPTAIPELPTESPTESPTQAPPPPDPTDPPPPPPDPPTSTPVPRE